MTLLERTGNIQHIYLQIFTMDVEMDNLSTKPLSLYDGSVNGLSDQKKSK